ncbi:MAG: glycosyltransferase family 9 protein [Ignavibacteria bacterium]|jgi:lipopolysaccharide heptosyltransferase II
MKAPKKILIVRPDRIGDVVLTIPMVHVIKKHFPSAEVSILIRSYTAPLVKNLKSLSNIFILKERKDKIDFLSNLKILRQENFDYAFVVHSKFLLALILCLSNIKTRIGTGYRWYSFLFNKKIYEHRKYGTNHELLHNMNMLKTIGINENVDEENVQFNIQVDDESKQKVKNELSKTHFDKDKKTIIIHPGSGGSSKDLPFLKIKTLANLLAQQLFLNVILTGSKSEIQMCNNIANKNKALINLAGKFNLSELTAVISLSNVVVANSTGPIHIAAALGKHAVGFYPKVKSCSQKRWGPFTNKKLIFEPEINCSNCTVEQCEKLNCMDSIDVQKVFEKMKPLFNN